MCISSSAPQETQPGPMESAMVDLSENQLKHYNDTYDPLARDRVKEANELDGNGARVHNTNILASQARTGLGALKASAGSASALKQATVNKSLNEASRVALATSQGELISKNEAMAAKLGVVQSGRGQSQTASQTYGNVAANEYAENVTRTQANAQVSAARSGALGTVAGMGAGYWLNKPPALNQTPAPKSAYLGLNSNSYNHHV